MRTHGRYYFWCSAFDNKEKTDIFRLPFSLLALSVTLIPIDMAQARSPDRQVVFLQCSGEAASGAAAVLCREMVQALAETAGAVGSAAIIRQVSDDKVPSGRPGDLGVTLRMTDGGPSSFTAQLQWQQGQRPPTSGPELRLDVMNRDLGSAQLARFARDLIKATPGISSALRDPP
ncbi:hypothetical protein PGB28_14220 [Primorskyibacter aestuariivivens]|uniref:hypothetical protein n=1 Tax=Primorskyibacter aestuariivivens TaxID=1888912 RepID=UPI0023010831|nr:hypothetical protein [Primorskyibacter aestuariivivens]MDA7429622.1 hypothetical protein [Primorskyibacter aestuariivivens]